MKDTHPHLQSPIHRCPVRRPRITRKAAALVGFVCGIITAVIPACQTLQKIADSPAGKVAISAGGITIVKESVERRPEITPILLSIASGEGGLNAAETEWENPYFGLAADVVNQLIYFYGAESDLDEIIRESIHLGISLAEPPASNK